MAATPLKGKSYNRGFRGHGSADEVAMGGTVQVAVLTGVESADLCECCQVVCDDMTDVQMSPFRKVQLLFEFIRAKRDGC